ncbi:MAG: glycosyltransferase family 1 protein [Chloroflexota bacterium]
MFPSHPDVLCFSHLPWDLVFQRPNHLMSRAARDRRVFYVEEPQDADRPGLSMRVREGGVVVVTPMIPARISGTARETLLRVLVDTLIETERISNPRVWYYTPLAVPWTRHIESSAVVYDCMDQLSAFRNAPPELLRLEPELLARADVVFTGGHRLYEAKRGSHPEVHPFPSAVDVGHFQTARRATGDPADQAKLRRPRIGYYGVIDERLDLPLIEAIARRRPDWSVILVGPVVKIDPADIPDLPNVHALGPKPYAELPAYLSGWDVAIMPFARNEATEFISPTKTPEYLAGGRPVVSTSIADVVRPYGELGLARIADEPDDFIAAIEAALGEDPATRLAAADSFLARMSWDRTWQSMDAIAARAERRRAARRVAEPVAAPAPVRTPVRIPSPSASRAGTAVSSLGSLSRTSSASSRGASSTATTTATTTASRGRIE